MTKLINKIPNPIPDKKLTISEFVDIAKSSLKEDVLYQLVEAYREKIEALPFDTNIIAELDGDGKLSLGTTEEDKDKAKEILKAVTEVMSNKE